jgi:uncharacterized membrane protein
MLDPTIWSKAHGASTHFPIALMITSALCDTAGLLRASGAWGHALRSAGATSVVVGAAASLAGAATGLILARGQWWGHGALLQHHRFVWPGLMLMLVLAAWRLSMVRNSPHRLPLLYRVLSFSAAVLMGAAGYWGGEVLNGG